MPSDRYRRAFVAQTKQTERSLRMILDEEERRSRDDVLLALYQFQAELKEQNTKVSNETILRAWEQATGASAAEQDLFTLVHFARKRKVARDKAEPWKPIDETMKIMDRDNDTKTEKDNVPCPAY